MVQHFHSWGEPREALWLSSLSPATWLDDAGTRTPDRVISNCSFWPRCYPDAGSLLTVHDRPGPGWVLRLLSSLGQSAAFTERLLCKAKDLMRPLLRTHALAQHRLKNSALPEYLALFRMWIKVGPQCKMQWGEKSFSICFFLNRHLFKPQLWAVGLGMVLNAKVRRTQPWTFKGGAFWWASAHPGSSYLLKQKAAQVVWWGNKGVWVWEHFAGDEPVHPGLFLCAWIDLPACLSHLPAGGCPLMWFIPGGLCWFLRVNIRKIIFFGELWNCLWKWSPAELPPGAWEK